jgi:hypothetical protein
MVALVVVLCLPAPALLAAGGASGKDKLGAAIEQRLHHFVQHVRTIGGDFHAFDIVRRGRVIYSASTAAAPDPNAPAVPTRDFHALVGEVSTPLSSSTARGCPPPL